MFGYELYKWASLKGIEAEMFVFLILFMFILKVLLFKTTKGPERNDPQSPDYFLCQHCKYRKKNKEHKFIMLCSRYKSKPPISLRKQTECPFESVEVIESSSDNRHDFKD